MSKIGQMMRTDGANNSQFVRRVHYEFYDLGSSICHFMKYTLGKGQDSIVCKV